MGTELEKIVDKLENLSETLLRFEIISEDAIISANGLEELAENISELSFAVGSLFLPALQNLLPYANGFVMALKQLVVWVSELIGIDNSDIFLAIGVMNLNELITGAEDAEKNLDGTVASVKQFKGNLQGLDELNIISLQKNGAHFAETDLSESKENLEKGTFSDWQEEWEKIVLDMENRTNQIAEEIEKKLKPVKTIIGELFEGNYYTAGQNISGLVTGIANAFADAIAKVSWDEVGENLGEFLEGLNWDDMLNSVGRVIWEGLKATIVLWGETFKATPIETSIVTAIALLKWSGITPSLFEPFKSSMVTALTPVVSSAFSTVMEGVAVGSLTWYVGSEVLEEVTGKEGLADTIQSYGLFNFLRDFGDTWNGLPARTTLKGQEGYAFGDALDAIAKGTIYSDKQMTRMQEKWNFTEEDMESLRQAMLMYNENLQEIADGFGLFEASADTLKDVEYGLQIIVEGGVSVSKAGDEFAKPMWGMTDAAKEFFETIQNRDLVLEEWQIKMLQEKGYTTDFIRKISKEWDEHCKGIEKGLYASMKTTNELNNMTDMVLSNGRSKGFNYGVDLVTGYAGGINSSLTLVKEASSILAMSAVRVIEDKLGIHSPSKVMFELGGFTMKGYQLGLEDTYDSIGESVEKFGKEIQYDIAPLQKLQGNVYGYTWAQGSGYMDYSISKEHIAFDVSETNILLRELLNVTKAGHVIEYRGRELGRTVQNEDREYYKRVGKGMFEH